MKNSNLFKKSTNQLFNSAINHNVDHHQEENIMNEPLNQTIFCEFQKQNRKRSFFLRLTFVLIVLNLVLIVQSFSQIITVNNVAITNTAQITAKGDILSNNGASIINNGVITVNGNFTNESGSGLFGTSAGTVTLNGANQNIGGSSVTNFNNLNLQSTGIVTLQNDILTGGSNGTNNGVLSLGTSVMSLNSHELTVNNSNANGITRTNGYIAAETDANAGYGEIKWMVKNNTGNYIFPFGNSSSGHYLPVTFEISAAGTGPNGYIKLSTYPTTTSATPNNRPLPTGLTSLISYFGTENANNVLDRWWVMDVGSYSDNPTTSLTFTYRDSEWNNASGSTNTISENTLQAQSNNYINWTPIPTGSINTFDNTLHINALNYFNPLWTLSGNDTPLPMELLAFDARLNTKRTVDINWITATQVNNDYFTVEKSRDGEIFESLEEIDGAGTSSNVLYYSSVDYTPYEGLTYYRIKQTDFDGNYSYSQIKAVKLESELKNNLSVFPNPAKEFFYIKFEKQTIPTDILILDAQGKNIKTIAVSAQSIERTQTIQVDCTNFAPGIYTISAPGIGTERVVIQ